MSMAVGRAVRGGARGRSFTNDSLPARGPPLPLDGPLPEALRSRRVFISSDAHCSRLSVRRPLYLERNSCVVFCAMICSIAASAAGSIL